MTELNILELIKPDGGVYRADSLKSATDFCKKIAVSHYENFPVASSLIPKNEREHIYAFARVADDIGDELNISAQEKIKALDAYEDLLMNHKFSYSGNPIFVALTNSVKLRKLPLETLRRLLIAFKMDSDFKPPNTYEDIEKYCHYSANPIGELLLRIFSLWNDITEPLSNAVCTGLQAANFWQDLSLDIPNGRVYIPKETLDFYGIDDINSCDKDTAESLILELCNYAESLLLQGSKLIKHLSSFRLKLEIAITIEGGLKIINETKKLKSLVLKERPKLSKLDFATLPIKAILFHRTII